GKVVDITVDHTDTPFVADPAIKRLVPALIEEQGYVDAISQATVTSTALFKAVEDALTAKDSGVKPFDVQVGDGEYEGVADSFGGQMTVKVKVEGGKVVDITVDHTDTPFVADPAIKRLVPVMIEEQGYVDAISQATVTSTALFNAVEDALSRKEAE
ncbi:MAG: FMN-binding protein, partial [Firmicutes bacterium]|nr:FMN-binding protein [Bacillota bacterium]